MRLKRVSCNMHVVCFHRNADLETKEKRYQRDCKVCRSHYVQTFIFHHFIPYIEDVKTDEFIRPKIFRLRFHLKFFQDIPSFRN